MKSKYRQKFYDLYVKELLPVLIKYEDKRKRELNKFIAIMGITVIVLLVTGYLFSSLINPALSSSCSEFMQQSPYLMVIVMLLLLASVAAVCMLPGHYTKKFKRDLKEICKPTFFKCFNNLVWSKSDKYDKGIIESSNLFGYFNRERYDDIFTITHEGVKIEVIEADFEDVQGSGKNKRTYDIFKGVIIIFPSNKIVRAHTVVSSKGDNLVRNTRAGLGISVVSVVILFVYFLLFNDLGAALACGIGLLAALYAYRKTKPKQMEKINLEDVEFDKRFQVASEDQLEARYLITPAFMSRLKGLQTGFGTKKIKCAFFDDKVMFAISTKEDLFEVGSLFVPLSNSKQMSKFFDELTSILEMVDHFKLDQKTGM